MIPAQGFYTSADRQACEIPAHAQVLPVAGILDAPTLKALVDVLVTRHGPKVP